MDDLLKKVSTPQSMDDLYAWYAQQRERAAEYIDKHNANQTCVVLPFRKKEG